MWPLGCLSVEVHCSGGKPLYPKSENDVRIKAIAISYEPHGLARGCSQKKLVEIYGIDALAETESFWDYEVKIVLDILDEHA